jgi:hypothetical protein
MRLIMGNETIGPRPEVPQVPEILKKWNSLSAATNRISKLVGSQRRSFFDLRFAPGVINVIGESPSDKGTWFTDQWSGSEKGFIKNTYDIFYLLPKNSPMVIEGINAPVYEIRASVVRYTEQRRKQDNRFFALQVKTIPAGQKEPHYTHSYCLSVDHPTTNPSGKENMYPNPTIQDLSFETAMQLLNRVENIAKESNTSPPPQSAKDQ